MNTTTTTTKETTMTTTYTTFDAMTEHDDWLGFGYIGSRLHLTPEDRHAGDALVTAFAEADGWSDADLFEWANSRYGRHYADAIDGASDLDAGHLELALYSDRTRTVSQGA